MRKPFEGITVLAFAAILAMLELLPLWLFTVLSVLGAVAMVLLMGGGDW